MSKQEKSKQRKLIGLTILAAALFVVGLTAIGGIVVCIEIIAL